METRTIMFNCWDKKNKKMLSFTKILKNFIKYWEDPNFILLQYLGINDKKKEQVFDGDVLEDKEGELWEVTWFDIWDISLVSCKTRICNPDKYWDICLMEKKGNKYENPKLVQLPKDFEKKRRLRKEESKKRNRKRIRKKRRKLNKEKKCGYGRAWNSLKPCSNKIAYKIRDGWGWLYACKKHMELHKDNKFVIKRVKLRSSSQKNRKGKK